MTARIAQSVAPRSRSDFRSSLRFANFIPTRPSRQAGARQTFSKRPLAPLFNRQAGAMTHSTITMSLGLIALITVSLLGFFYLQQVMGTASQGTDIHALETSIVDLKEKQKALELQGAELRSLKNIEGKVEKLNLVTIDKVAYINVPTDKVALSSPLGNQ